jgi:hypothetical protein
VLEEEQLQRAFVVAYDRLAFWSDTGLRDPAGHLAGFFEPLRVGRNVEHVDAAVLCDFFVIEPLRHGERGRQK